MLGDNGLGRFEAEFDIGDIHFLRVLASAFDHHFLDFGNRLSGIQPLWTGPSAVEDRVAPVEPERVFQDVETFTGRFVAAISQPAPSLKKCGGTKKTIRIPPMTWAARGAAKTKDTFVVAVELAALLR